MNEFEKLLKECLELHNKKAHDYSSDSDKYSNFKVAAYILSLFKNPIDQVFACMIGIKLSRLAELRNGKDAKNESLRDTGLDLINYAALWQSFWDANPDYGKIPLRLVPSEIKVTNQASFTHNLEDINSIFIWYFVNEAGFYICPNCQNSYIIEQDCRDHIEKEHCKKL